MTSFWPPPLTTIQQSKEEFFSVRIWMQNNAWCAGHRRLTWLSSEKLPLEFCSPRPLFASRCAVWGCATHWPYCVAGGGGSIGCFDFLHAADFCARVTLRCNFAPRHKYPGYIACFRVRKWQMEFFQSGVKRHQSTREMVHPSLQIALNGTQPTIPIRTVSRPIILSGTPGNTDIIQSQRSKITSFWIIANDNTADYAGNAHWCKHQFAPLLTKDRMKIQIGKRECSTLPFT